jgi:Zn-finger nucleic acid-binding protein
MTRVSDRARFCHRCGTPVVPQGKAGEPTRHACPACGRGQRLTSRSLGEPAVAVLECPRCAGLWLDNAAFDLVRERAREQPAAEPQASAASTPPAGAHYRRCPHCEALMHRRNHGGKSGVLVDTCREHGLWFDRSELERVLAWIRGGGERAAAEQAQSDERHVGALGRLRYDREGRTGALEASRPERTDFVTELLRYVGVRS